MGTATFVTHEETRVFEVRNPRPNPGTGFHNYYFGERHVAVPGPQGYMVNFDPQLRNRAHFHHVDQFQVFFGTPGCTYQRHEIGPLMLHYADADTVYGPFGSGDGPLSFITLRRNGSDFIGYLPEDRDKLAKRARRLFEVALDEWLDEPIPPAGSVSRSEAIPPQPDGLQATLLTAGPETTISVEGPEGSGGQYYVVVEGELLLGDRRLPPKAVGWAEPNDDAPSLVAGGGGSRLLVLRFSPTPA